MLRPFQALARSSTFWLGLIVNLAAVLSTGQLSTTLLIATLASYSAKEGLRHIAERPTSADVVLERTIAELELLDGETEFRAGDDPAAHEMLYATRVRPVLRHLRAMRRPSATESVRASDRAADKVKPAGRPF